MAYWLLKTEPEDYSWGDLVKRGRKGEAWTGVRNFSARGHLKEMKKCDRAFVYHTGDEKQVVGVAEVIAEQYPDPTAKKDESWVVVDVAAIEPMPKPVTLADVKADKRFKDMALVKYGRLSVQPVTPEHWKAICKMGGIKG
jgi:predicted RNA-binding protein with PUA-like domain